MTKKEKKFISFSKAIQEILDDFRLDPKQCDLFAKVYVSLAGGEAIPGEEECPPFGFKYGGIWYRPDFLKEKMFHSLQEFHDLLVQAFISKSPSNEDVSRIYRTVMGVKAYVGTGCHRRSPRDPPMAVMNLPPLL